MTAHIDARGMGSVLEQLVETGERLRSIPVVDRAGEIARAAAPWTDDRSRERVGLRQPLIQATGFSGPVIDRGLDGLFGALTGEALLTWWGVASHEKDHGRFGWTSSRPGPVAIVAAGNIPGVALFPLAGALLAGRPVVVKPASSEPLTAAAWHAGGWQAGTAADGLLPLPVE